MGYTCPDSITKPNHHPPHTHTYLFLPCTHNPSYSRTGLTAPSCYGFMYLSPFMRSINWPFLFLVSLTMTRPAFSYEIFSSSSFNRYSKIDLKQFHFGLSAEPYLRHSESLCHNNRALNDLSPTVTDCVLKQYDGCETQRWMLMNTWV